MRFLYNRISAQLSAMRQALYLSKLSCAVIVMLALRLMCAVVCISSVGIVSLYGVVFFSLSSAFLPLANKRVHN